MTSGDVARTLIARYAGRPIFHIGPERDLATFAGLDVERVPPEDAEAIVCTGLFDDERETPDDYAATLKQCAARALTMICANPDVMVERGGRMIYCAGAIARAYEALGGKVEYAGKPYAPIYALHVRDAGEAEAPAAPTRLGCSPSATASAPTLPAPPRPACARCSSPAGCMSKAASTARPSRPCFRPGAPRPIAAMAKLAW